MIIGVTHDQDGRVVQRLSVSTKVSIGLPPNGDRNHPTKLDHFVFLRKKKAANRVEWEVDPDLTAHYGEQCREMHIILIDDDIENVFLREEATYFDRKEKRKKTSSIWALSLEVEGDDMRKLIANLTENARLFAETRKLLGSGGKVLEVVEDEQEQSPEFVAEFYPPSVSGSSATEPGEAASTPETTLGNAPSNSHGETPPTGNGTGVTGGNGIAKPHTSGTTSSPAPNNGNGSAASSGFNQLRNEFLTAARRVATTKKQAIGEVVEWASGGAFKYGDVGHMTEADTPKLRAATDLMASTLAGASC